MRLWTTLLLMTALGATGPVDYQCLDGTSFTLIADDEAAIVRFADGEYRLSRRPSSLAVKYESRVATLYLDGDIAAFVADDRPLPGCHRFKMRNAETTKRPEGQR